MHALLYLRFHTLFYRLRSSGHPIYHVVTGRTSRHRCRTRWEKNVSTFSDASKRMKYFFLHVSVCYCTLENGSVVLLFSVNVEQQPSLASPLRRYVEICLPIERPNKMRWKFWCGECRSIRTLSYLFELAPRVRVWHLFMGFTNSLSNRDQGLGQNISKNVKDWARVVIVNNALLCSCKRYFIDCVAPVACLIFYNCDRVSRMQTCRKKGATPFHSVDAFVSLAFSCLGVRNKAQRMLKS